MGMNERAEHSAGAPTIKLVFSSRVHELIEIKGLRSKRSELREDQAIPLEILSMLSPQGKTGTGLSSD